MQISLDENECLVQRAHPGEVIFSRLGGNQQAEKQERQK